MNKKIVLLSILSFSFLGQIQAQEVASKGLQSPFYNPVFLAMTTLAFVLLFIIIVLTNVIKTTIKSKVRDLKIAKGLKVLSALFLMFGSGQLMAQEAAVKVSIYEDVPIFGIHPWTFYIMFAIILIELFVILWFCLAILRLVVVKEEKEAVKAGEVVVKENKLYAFIQRKLLGVKPVESDRDVLLDHDYDGIKELDNDLPPWWKYGFYLTILSGTIYFVGYHVTGTFKSSEQEYLTEMADAEKSVNEYRLKMALNVDETNVVFVDDAAKIENGKALFVKNCVVCHGAEGQGTIGPNFTDKYWIYGGHAKDLFTVVKNGAKNGMKAWKDELSPTEIQNVISYIHTLKGTNPANPKAPQGELFEESVGSDSTVSETNNLKDSIKIIETK